MASRGIDVFEVVDVGTTKVSLVHGELPCDERVDVVVSSDDTSVSMSGGVSEAIRRRGGSQVQSQAQAQLPQPVGSVLISTAGDLNAQHVFHALVVDWELDLLPDSLLIKETTIRCLEEASIRKCVSIAFPAMGTGAGQLSAHESARSILEGATEYLSDGLSSIKEIYVFVVSPSGISREFLRQFTERRVSLGHQAELQKLHSRIYELESQKAELEKRATADAEPSLRKLAHPIAYAWAVRHIANSPFEYLKALLDAFEATTKYLAIVSMSSAIRAGAITKQDCVDRFKKPPGFGEWLSMFREWSKWNHEHPDESFTPSLSSLFWTKKSKQTDIAGDLNMAVEERNKSVHGPLEPENVYAEKVNQLEPKIVSLLESVGEAVPFPLVAVRDFSFGPDDDFIYTVTRVMGESSVFRSEVVASRLRLPKGTLGLWDVESAHFLDVGPFITLQTCPICHQQDTFFLSRSEGNNGTYMTYRGNHQLTRELEVPNIA